MQNNYTNLTDCRDCREFVSKSAKVCPHCGAIKPGKPHLARNRYRLIIISLALVVALGTFFVLRLVDRDSIDTEICSGLICDEYVVTAITANVREKPSTESAIIFSAKQGDVAVVLQQQGNWMFMYFYNTEHQQGWIHNQLIEHVKTID